MQAASWVHAAGSTPGTVTPSRLRSLTPTPASNKHVTKSISTPHLNKLARPNFDRSDSEVMNTIPDPRESPTPKTTLSRNDSNDSSPHPDLSQEVATLSTKLINSINHQDALDNSLQQTRHELEATREKLAEYEEKVRRHEQSMATGRLVESEVYEKMEKQLNSELQEERKRRMEAEKAKRKVDNEVETLTSALFEEANTVGVLVQFPCDCANHV
jgi:Rab guanine nucleotide exchange factor SEC2